MRVPFIDLKAHHEPIRGELMAAIDRVVGDNAFAGGKFVETFEEEYATYCGARHAIGVGSGTEALWFILKALGLGPDDEVITTPCTFFATVEAVLQLGAKPVFVDIDECTYNIDPDKIESAITDRTKAIIPVHLFGQLADMEKILAIGRQYGIPVVEDAAQAHGARMPSGERAGSIGIAGAFSFYPSKNLGAMGEAGAVVTNDDSLAAEIRSLRDHGQSSKYVHTKVGWNGRMDGIQAAVLEIKLRDLDTKNEARRSVARRYNELLGSCDELSLPACPSWESHVFHIYSLAVGDRDGVKQSLEIAGIDCGIHYPIPMHLQTACKFLDYSIGDLPIAERCCNQFLSLPMYPEISDKQIEFVAESLISSMTKPVSI